MKTSNRLLLSMAVVLSACSDRGTDSEAANAAVDLNKKRVQHVNAPPVTGVAEQKNPAAELRALTDHYMDQLLKSSPYLQMMAGDKLTGLNDNSFAGAKKRAHKAQILLQKLKAIDPSQLAHDDQLTYAMFKGQLELTLEQEKYFWHNFNVTPYAVNNGVSILLPGVLAGTMFNADADIDNYLSFLQDLGRYLEDDLNRLKAQESRGILLPMAAVPGARAAIDGIRQTVVRLTTLDQERVSALSPAERSRLAWGIEDAVQGRLTSAVNSLLAFLGDAYIARAPRSVGLGQYPGGEEAYRFAIRQQTTMDLDPADIHHRGLRYMEDIQQKMADIRRQLGFKGTAAEFHQQMRDDPRFYAKTPEEVAERYQDYIRRIEPHIKNYFALLPAAPFGVKRLDPAAEPGMTFGYYQAPSAVNPVGNYRFNGSKLESRPMVWSGALVYHELVPGHHFHIALARENEQASDFRRSVPLLYAAFTEGWANYGASLAYEMGIMNDPWDRYGWLLFDAFITNRLVVDTGMNYLGWSLEQARVYMMANTFSSREEADTETLRYSTDMPAQSLAYKLGYEKIREIRTFQEQKWGDQFDIRKFHAATVGSGGMPLPMLGHHVDWYMKNGDQENVNNTRSKQ